MSPRTIASFLLVLLALLFVLPVGINAATPSNQVSTTEQQISNALVLVQEAGAAGGNVTSLVSDLNKAAQLLLQSQQTRNSTLAEADLSQAAAIAQNVTESAPAIDAQGIASARNHSVSTFVELAFVGSFAVVVYAIFPLVYGRLWTRAHKDWRLETT